MDIEQELKNRAVRLAEFFGLPQTFGAPEKRIDPDQGAWCVFRAKETPGDWVAVQAREAEGRGFWLALRRHVGTDLYVARVLEPAEGPVSTFAKLQVSPGLRQVLTARFTGGIEAIDWFDLPDPSSLEAPKPLLTLTGFGEGTIHSAVPGGAKTAVSAKLVEEGKVVRIAGHFLAGVPPESTLLHLQLPTAPAAGEGTEAAIAFLGQQIDNLRVTYPHGPGIPFGWGLEWLTGGKAAAITVLALCLTGAALVCGLRGTDRPTA